MAWLIPGVRRLFARRLPRGWRLCQTRRRRRPQAKRLGRLMPDQVVPLIPQVTGQRQGAALEQPDLGVPVWGPVPHLTAKALPYTASIGVQ
jgi:hypothetical protein